MAARCAGCGEGFDKGSDALYAMRRLWHKDHFVCVVCTRSLRQSDHFRINAGQATCIDCLVASNPKCAGCGRTLCESCIVAVDRSWHRSCFVCAGCQHPFAENEHYLLDGLAYDVDCYWKHRCELIDAAQTPSSSGAEGLP